MNSHWQHCPLTSFAASLLSSGNSLCNVTSKLACISSLKLALLTLKYCIWSKYLMAFLRGRGRNSSYTNTMHCALQIHITLGQISEFEFNFLPFYLYLKFLLFSLMGCGNSYRTHDCLCCSAILFISLKKKWWTKEFPMQGLRPEFESPFDSGWKLSERRWWVLH